MKLTENMLKQIVREEILKEGQLSNWIQNDGLIRLYHFTTDKGETLTLDPQRFLSAGEEHSKRERETSQTPRIFFYLSNEPEHTEKWLVGGRVAYFATVRSNDTYDLKTDPQKIVKQSIKEDYGVKKVDWDMLFDLIKKNNYKGVFYSIRENIDVVAWFYPIEVRRLISTNDS